jgi:glycosyltransferase involved in cell wall biosynthesis
MRYIAALAALPLLIVILNSLTMRTIKASTAKTITELVSILIPMRNEERNASKVIEAIGAQVGLQKSEFLVLNDHSQDLTQSILQNYNSVNSLTGQDLPDGWLGKNYACHQLVAHSKGEYLVFLDADVRIAPRAISASITSMKYWGWDFVSPYPRQIAFTFIERLIQPLLQWSWLSSVFLRLAEKLRFKSMVIANGQFFVVKRSAYIASGGHKAIKSEILDDLELARLLVSSGFKGGVADGSSVAECRMYNNGKELFGGYSKSLWRAFGGIPGTIFALTFLFLTGTLPFVIALTGNRWAWVGYTFIVMSRLIAALKTRSTISTAFLHPLSILLFIFLNLNSWTKKARGTLTWRDRSVA